MATLDDLARRHTRLDPSALGHLRRVVGSWGLLADFCFSDLLLFVPVADGGGFVIAGQIRPTTGQTLYRDDLLGTIVAEGDRELVTRCWRLEQIIDGEHETAMGERARIQCIPVRWKGEMLAVLTRESAPSVGRRLGELERTYLAIFERFARMIADGEFPFATEDTTAADVPRVGDGVMLLDEGARVEYVSPNAVSALHRMGVFTNAVGMRFGELALDESAVRGAFAFGVPVTVEVTRAAEVAVVVRCIPLLREGTVDGAVVLLRDVSDLRRRDRLLLSKDAAIREVHHRVKNNLQTISSLLRLQARRTESEESRAVIEESVRRIRSIALVHETLSRSPEGESVAFDEIIRPLVRMVEEGLLSDERPVEIEVSGDAGMLAGQVATPLSVVLTELLQNAVDHAFPPPAGGAGHVDLRFANDGTTLTVEVRDNGPGLPDGFDVGSSTGLGLTIVRALVESELGGTISMRSDGGAVVEIAVPVQPELAVDRS
jgi:two-component sensor histidine kinase